MKAISLQQWKTIIGILALTAVGVAYSLGKISNETASTLGTIIGGATGVSMMLKANRIENQLKSLNEPTEPPK